MACGRPLVHVASRAVSAVSLFFIGAVLLCNGLTLLGRIQPRSAAPVNALVGVVLVAAAARLGVPHDASEADLVGAAGFLLFAITYLWVAINAYTRHDPAGLGWYCAWASGVSVFLGLVNVTHLDDDKFALLWLLWAVLFAVFFVVIALERTDLAVAAGLARDSRGAVHRERPGRARDDRQVGASSPRAGSCSQRSSCWAGSRWWRCGARRCGPEGAGLSQSPEPSAGSGRTPAPRHQQPRLHRRRHDHDAAHHQQHVADRVDVRAGDERRRRPAVDQPRERADGRRRRCC